MQHESSANNVSNDSSLYNDRNTVVNNRYGKKQQIRCLLTNARSLSPKILSLITMFSELQLHFAVVTESWLNDGETLDRDVIDLEYGTDLKILYKNRPVRAVGRRKVGGGVSIVYSKSKCNFRERRIASKKFEILIAVGKIGNMSREVAIFAIYIPPKMTAADLEEMREIVSDNVLQLKSSSSGQGPLFFIGGDLNRRDLGPALEDFLDIERKNFTPTRGNACLDILFSNCCMSEITNYPPLETPTGLRSDHECVLFSGLERTEKNFTWVKKTTRKFREQACTNFGLRIADTDWDAVMGDGSPEEQVARYERYTCGLVDELFPPRTIRMRSSDPPWITDGLRALARRKMRAYRRGRGKTPHWQSLQDTFDSMLEASKAEYVRGVEASGQGPSAYFRAVKALSTREKPSEWNVSSLFPDSSAKQAADKVAEYFTAISNEFEPIPEDANQTHIRAPVTLEEVRLKMKTARKPNSVVEGDILPALMKRFHATLAVPATKIFNAVFAGGRWPARWRRETAVIIPKTTNPTSLAETRNISCTSFLSKVLESFVLDDLRAEIPVDETQYGGLKGCSVNHLLVDAWDAILRPLDKGQHAVMLGVDFEKAFNRLDHAECIKQLRLLGASENSVSLVSSFLAGRSVQVKMPCGTMSELIKLCGGSPQGSILGSFLYCITTQQLGTNLVRARERVREADSDPDLERDPQEPPPDDAAPVEDEREGFALLQHLGDGRPEDSPSQDERTDVEEAQAGAPTLVLSPPHREAPTIMVFKYIDDTTTIENVASDTAIKHITTRRTIETIFPVETGLLLEEIVKLANEIGMRVNGKKTQLLCIALDNGCTTTATITCDGTIIQDTDRLKLLGFMFGREANVNEQFELIKRNFRARFWTLIHLKRSGFSGAGLFRLYSVFVRPMIENNSVVYDSMLTKYQSDQIERMQKRVAKLCYGFHLHYHDICSEHNIDSLADRRTKAVRKFVAKTMNNDRFARRWFTLRNRINNDLRTRRPYIEEKARTTRFYRSPLLTFQRIANDIATGN